MICSNKSMEQLLSLVERDDDKGEKKEGREKADISFLLQLKG